MDVTIQNFAYSDTSSSLSFITYLFTIFLGVMFSSKVPEIVSTLITGNPSMGFGSVVQTARGAMGALHTAQHFAKTAGNVGKTLWGGAQGLTRAGMGTVATLGAAGKAFDVAKEDLGKFNSDIQASGGVGYSDAQVSGAGVRAALSTIGSAIGQNLGDKTYKAMTGLEKEREKTDGGTLTVGQTFMDGNQERKAKMSDVRNAAQDKGSSQGSKVAQKLKDAYEKKSKGLPPQQ